VYFVFVDCEYGLGFPPDVFADFKHLPFRDSVFSLSFFDPSYGWSVPPWMNHPKGYVLGTGVNSKNRGTFYGCFDNRRHLITSIIKAQTELRRVSDRLCFKWNEYAISLWNILSCFTEWIEVYRLELLKAKKRGTNKTFWVTMEHRCKKHGHK